jgi:hypothetical protein
MFTSPRLMMGLFIVLATSGFASAQIAYATGKQYMQAVRPEGQLISFTYQGGGQTVACGIHVKELGWESHVDAGGAFVFVDDLKLVNNTMDCAYGPKDKPVSSDTTFSDVDFTSGRVLMTIATLPFSEPNKKYQLTLTSPFKGTMVPFRAKPALPQKKK